MKQSKAENGLAEMSMSKARRTWKCKNKQLAVIMTNV